MSDNRPAECRFRLQDEGKSYPRSSCKACGRHAFNGLGNHCHLADLSPSPEVVKELLKAAKALNNLQMWTETADDAEMVIVSVGTVRRIRAVLAKLEGGE